MGAEIGTKKASFNLANFIPGTIVDVEASQPKGARFKTRLIGVDDGKYLILKTPDLSSEPFIKESLKEANGLIVRFLAGNDSGECLAFRSTIKWVVGYPDKMLFLDYPAKIENRQLRNELRVTTRMPAKICSEIDSVNDETEQVEVSVTGVIVDISKHGCRFTFNAPENTKGIKSKEVQVIVNIGTESKALSITGEVCNQKKSETVFSLGIKFTEIPPQLESQLQMLLID